MKNRIILSIVGAATLVFPLAGLAQKLQREGQGQREGFGRDATETQSEKELTPGPGWKTCPRCTNNKQLALAYKNYKVEGHAFDPHDLSGVWGNNGMELDVKNVPPFTPEGQKMFEATKSDIPTTNSKDGMLICDPLGYPRSFAYNYGMQFVMLPDRVLQFFEWGHTWRDIWIDGRKLPDNPPQQRWLGYAVGHWEGDTFVVEGTGYDERSWISEDRRNRIRGFAHSDRTILRNSAGWDMRWVTGKGTRLSWKAPDMTKGPGSRKTGAIASEALHIRIRCGPSSGIREPVMGRSKRKSPSRIRKYSRSRGRRRERLNCAQMRNCGNTSAYQIGRASCRERV